MQQISTTDEWKALSRHAGDVGTLDLRELFSTDSDRGTRLTASFGDVLLDYSKNLVTDETMELLVALGHRADVPGRFAAMLAGEHLNVTDDRAVLHTALRAPRDATIHIDGRDVVADVHAVLDRMAAFAYAVRSGQWRGHTGAEVTTVVNIGIGGSDLGPAMAHAALADVADGPDVRFVSNIDGADIATRWPTWTPRPRCSWCARRRSGRWRR